MPACCACAGVFSTSDISATEATTENLILVISILHEAGWGVESGGTLHQASPPLGGFRWPASCNYVKGKEVRTWVTYSRGCSGFRLRCWCSSGSSSVAEALTRRPHGRGRRRRIAACPTSGPTTASGSTTRSTARRRRRSVLAYGIGGNADLWDVNVEALAAAVPRGAVGATRSRALRQPRGPRAVLVRPLGPRSARPPRPSPGAPGPRRRPLPRRRHRHSLHAALSRRASARCS